MIKCFPFALASGEDRIEIEVNNSAETSFVPQKRLMGLRAETQGNRKGIFIFLIYYELN